MDNSKQVALTIMEQIRWNRVRAMTGAKNPSYGKDTDGNPYFGFTLPRGLAGRGIQWVRIILTPKDLYTVVSGNRKGNPVETREDVYADGLVKALEGVTSLAFSL